MAKVVWGIVVGVVGAILLFFRGAHGGRGADVGHGAGEDGVGGRLREASDDVAGVREELGEIREEVEGIRGKVARYLDELKGDIRAAQERADPDEEGEL